MPKGTRTNKSSAALLLMAVGALVMLGTEAAPSEAAPAAPQLDKLLSANARVDSYVDEIRVDFILTVPHGSVDASTGAGLTLAYDYFGAATPTPGYTASFMPSSTAADANAWAANQNQNYTILKTFTEGASDDLVISLQGDLNLPDAAAADNVPGGGATTINLYATVTGSTQTTIPLDFHVYSGASSVTDVSGPEIQPLYDDVWGLWSAGQANAGAVLDHGLNGQAAGVLPANSIAVPLMNAAFQSTASGPAGSVSDSFWYAWVNEDGSLVGPINAQPIHVTGITPVNGGNDAAIPAADSVYNAVGQHGQSASSPNLANAGATPGLGSAVHADGSIDFNGVGGDGYYRLLVWPESHDPVTVTADYGAPELSYSTPPTDAAQAFVAATVFYDYASPTPAAPTISAPAAGASTTETTPTITGAGADIGNLVTVLIDGVTVGTTTATAGGWTLTPAAPLALGAHTITATQTSGFGVVSAPSAAHAITVTAPPASTAPAPAASASDESSPSPTATSTPFPSVSATPSSSVAPGGTPTPVPTATPAIAMARTTIQYRTLGTGLPWTPVGIAASLVLVGAVAIRVALRRTSGR